MLRQPNLSQKLPQVVPPLSHPGRRLALNLGREHRGSICALPSGMLSGPMLWPPPSVNIVLGARDPNQAFQWDLLCLTD